MFKHLRCKSISAHENTDELQTTFISSKNPVTMEPSLGDLLFHNARRKITQKRRVTQATVYAATCYSPGEMTMTPVTEFQETILNHSAGQVKL